MTLSKALIRNAVNRLNHNFSDVEQIGQGAFGVVFKGAERTTGAVRAIKVIRTNAHLLSSIIDADRRNGDVFAIGLQHVYIAAVYDVNVLVREDLLAAVVMEFVEGETLREYVDEECSRQREDADGRHRLLESGFVARVTACMLSALEYCGRRGIVHQDIEPESIVVCSADGVPCKLIDFGFAGVVRNGVYINAAGGTAEYSAPEKLRGEASSTRADVYSLGMVVYEMIVLTLPDGDPHERAQRRVSINLPAAVPHDYCRMLVDMLQSSAERRPKAEWISGRFQTTDEFKTHCDGRVEMVSEVSLMKRLVERDYDAVEYLGGGAFGQVFRGRHRLMGSEWAVKVVDASVHIGERLLIDVRHENLARVHFIGHVDTLVCVHMELASGVSLTKVLSDCVVAIMEGDANRLTESGAAWWMMEALVRALACLEEHGIIHEDIKPDSVVVDEGSKCLKLIDFGLAVRIGDETGIGGTQLYCAPEKLRREMHDCRADVYSAGAVMWEIVMLRPLAENDADADRKARGFVDGELETGEPQWAQRVTRMLKSRPSDRAAASALLVEVGGTKKSVEQLERENAAMQMIVQEMLAEAEQRITNAQRSATAAIAEAEQRVADAERRNLVLQSRCTELETLLAPVSPIAAAKEEEEAAYEELMEEAAPRMAAQQNEHPISREPVAGAVAATASVAPSSGVVVRQAGLRGLLAVEVPDVLEGMRIVSSVSEAVRVATSGMTVYVLPGEYRESVVVDKDVTVVGYGFTSTGGIGVEESALGAKIIGSNAGPALTVTSKATVRGLRLENASEEVNTVEVTGGSGWVIEGCRVSGTSGLNMYLIQNYGGIVISGGKGTVRSCTVCGCVGNGIVVGASSDVTVERCMVIRNNENGVIVSGKAYALLIECDCMENESCGITTFNTCSFMAGHCRFMNNGAFGVCRGESSSVLLRDCTLSGNKNGDKKDC
jgi:serine/threonine protein kinase